MQPSQELSIIERFRAQHHAVARMFASGMTPSMIRQRTGLSNRRLALLYEDPSFQELIAVYAQRVEEKWDASLDTYLDLGMSNMILSESMIAERLEEAQNVGAEPIPLAMLDKISQGRADRFGYGRNATVEHKHDFSSMLDRAIERSGKAKEVKQIESSVARGNLPDVPEHVGKRLAHAPATDAIEGQVLPDAPVNVEPVTQVAAPRPSPVTKAQPRSFAQVLNPIKKRKIA